MASHVVKGQLGISIKSKQDRKSARTCCAMNKLKNTNVKKTMTYLLCNSGISEQQGVEKTKQKIIRC